jgi:hypothetical protein
MSDGGGSLRMLVLLLGDRLNRPGGESTLHVPISVTPARGMYLKGLVVIFAMVASTWISSPVFSSSLFGASS